MLYCKNLFHILQLPLLRPGTHQRVAVFITVNFNSNNSKLILFILCIYTTKSTKLYHYVTSFQSNKNNFRSISLVVQEQRKELNQLFRQNLIKLFKAIHLNQIFVWRILALGLLYTFSCTKYIDNF